MKYLVRIALVMLLAALAGGCHHGPTEQERQIMVQLDASLKTQCIGRYLADLPGSFEWLTPDVTLYYGRDMSFKTLDVQIVRQHTTLADFEKSVAQSEKDIAGQVLFEDQSKSLLLATVKEGANHAIMLRYFSDPSGIGIDHQLHLLIGNAHVLIKGSSFEGSSTNPEDLSPAVETRMLKLAQQIRSVTDPAKAGAGFCLGSVVVDSSNDYESASMDFGMAKHPDLTFHVYMSNQENDPQTLHQRLRRIDTMADGKRLTILRSRNLTLADMPAEEELARIVENRTEYQFVAEARPEHPSFHQEGTQISLTTGNQLLDGRYIDSTLTQNEAESLWDAIVKSFRPRPDAVRASVSK